MRDYSVTEIQNGIDEWVVGNNAERNREIMRMKLIKGYSYQKIADKLAEYGDETYKLETRQIQRIIRKYRTIIFRHI